QARRGAVFFRHHGGAPRNALPRNPRGPTVKIHFFEPPPAQKAGGLDAAIQSLRAALERIGHSVAISAGTPDAGESSVVHFQIGRLAEEQFSFDIMAERHETLYRETLAAQP